MSYTLTALKYLDKESPVISTDFTRTKDEQVFTPMEPTKGEEEGEGLNQRMRDILKTRQSEGRHQFMHKALQKWLAAPYRFNQKRHFKCHWLTHSLNLKIFLSHGNLVGQQMGSHPKCNQFLSEPVSGSATAIFGVGCTWA